MVLNLARRCREIDRQYEFNNNGDLDNGVYHKFVYNSEEKDGDDQNDEEIKEESQSNLNIPMLVPISELDDLDNSLPNKK